MKSAFTKLLIMFAGLIGTTACSPAPNKSMTLGLWITQDIDIAFVYVRMPDGKFLWSDYSTLARYRSDYYGWQTTGPGVLSFVETLPEYVMVSWRLPSSNETQFARCRRQQRKNCEGLPGDRNKDPSDYEDGQLIGPFKVPILSRLDTYAIKMLERGTGDFNTLQIGLGIGSENINFRWILTGTPPPGKTADNNTMELSRGGDW